MNRIMRAEAEAHAERPLWSRILVPGLVIFAIIIAFAGLLYARSGSDASHDVRESSKRADCRSAYNADFTEVIRTRDHAKIDLDILRYNADINRATGVAITQTEVNDFIAQRDEVQALNDKVDKLPRIDDAVDRGYTLNGVHHPPCPG